MEDFELVEALFQQLLVATEPVLTNSERAEIRHFFWRRRISSNVGNAVDICQEEGRRASDLVVSIVGQLANEMKLDSSALLLKLLTNTK